MELKKGTLIGNFEIIEEISYGGTSVCYKAYQKNLDRYVIFKVLLEHFARDKEIVDRFTREAKILAKFNHPNIVRVLDFGKIGNRYFIAMEYIEGDSLAYVIEKGGLPPERVADIIYELADALSYIHSRGIIHRDIKPSNIILKDGKTPVLVDFGLAFLSTLPRLTYEGMVLGTPAYVAPEQLKGKKPSPSCDIYSLGIVALEPLTGMLAYSGATYEEILNKVLLEPPSGLDKLNKFDHPIKDIVLKMIAPCEERINSAQELKKLLEPLYSGKLRLKKHRLNYIKLGMVASFVIIVLVLYYWQVRQKTSVRVPPSPTKVETMTIEPRKTHLKETPSITLTKTQRDCVKDKTRKKNLILMPKFNIKINVLPYAKIFVGDSLVGETPPPCKIVLRSGKYNFKFINPNFPIIKKTFKIVKNTNYFVNLFEEIAYLRVVVTPWAEVYIDDSLMAVTPHGEPIRVTPGEHKIRLHNPYGFKDWVKREYFEKGDTVHLRVRLEQ